MPLPFTLNDFTFHMDAAREGLTKAASASDHEKALLVAEAQAHATVAQTIAIWLQRT